VGEGVDEKWYDKFSLSHGGGTKGGGLCNSPWSIMLSSDKA